MASKNVNKVLNKIYTQNKNFRPEMNPVSWNKAVTYVKAKDKRLAFNAAFKPLFEQCKKELRDEGCHESQVKVRAKQKAKALAKTQLAVTAATQ